MNPAQTSLLADLRALPRAFWVLVAGTFVNRFGSFVYPFLTIFLGARGLSLGQIGAVIAGYGAGGLLASLAGGWFADRFGRRNTIVVGTLANAGCVAALYFVHEIPALTLLTFLAGVSGGFYHPASNALVADLIPAERRLAAYALLRQAANAGFTFGTAAGGFLVSHSAFWLFIGDALTTALFGIMALMLLPHGLRTASHQASWGQALAHIRNDGRFWALFTAQCLTALIFTQFVSSYALEVTDRHLQFAGLRPEQLFGALIGWNGLLVMLLELSITRVTQRFDPRRVMCLGYLLIGVGFSLNIMPGGVGTLLFGMTLFTIGEMLAMPMIQTWVAHLAPESMRGRYIGALGTGWSGASMCGPALGLLIYGWNPAALWLGCGLLGLCAAFVLARWGEGRRRDSGVADRLPAVLDAAE